MFTVASFKSGRLGGGKVGELVQWRRPYEHGISFRLTLVWGKSWCQQIPPRYHNPARQEMQRVIA